VGITVSGATITLRITAAGATAEECLAAMEPTVATIHQCLGTLVFGEEDDEPEHAVARLLAQRGRTLAIVECGTGGLIAHRLSEVSESDGRFLGGLVIRGRSALTRLLDISPELLEQHTGPSAAITGLLASGCRDRFGADLALAVSEFPTFDPQTADPGRVYFALASEAGVTTSSIAFAGHPAILKTRTAKQALNIVRLALLESAQQV
jgi:nicotinamide-nucleotide amidase